MNTIRLPISYLFIHHPSISALVDIYLAQEHLHPAHSALSEVVKLSDKVLPISRNPDNDQVIACTYSKARRCHRQRL